MNRSIFKSKFFFYFLLVLLIGLLVFNINMIIKSHDLSILLPIFIQLFLLTIIIIRHSILKISLKIWSLIFLIIAPMMQIIGKLLKDASYDYQFFELRVYIIPLIMLLIGCTVFYGTIKTIDKEKP